MFDILADFGDQLLDAGERAATDGLLGDDAKPALDLVDPRGVGRGVVHMEARSPREPGLDLGMFVRGVVVDDEMDVELGWHFLVDVPQEAEELLMPMTGFALRENVAVGDIKRGE